MELNFEVILSVITALALATIAYFKLRKAPTTEQPDPLAPGEQPTVPAGQDLAVLGLFADADGEKFWNYLDPSRHTLFVRLKGLKKGKFFVGLEVDGRVDSTCTLTVGENSPVEKIHSIAMEFPKYDRYRTTGTHKVAVLTGPVPPDVNPGAAPVWTNRTDYQVEVVKR